MNEDQAQKLLRNIPPALKRALIAEVKATGTNMNDVAVGIIADAYGMKFRPSEKRTPGLTRATNVGLTMPKRLLRQLNIEAAKKGTTATELMMVELLYYFDLLEDAA